MKHQLFKSKRYVQVDIDKPHLTVIGQVKDSTITPVEPIGRNKTHKIPGEYLELEPKLLVIFENPEVNPVFHSDLLFIQTVILPPRDSIRIHKDKLYASIYKLEVPAEELKEMYYEYNKGVKQQ